MESPWRRLPCRLRSVVQWSGSRLISGRRPTSSGSGLSRTTLTRWRRPCSACSGQSGVCTASGSVATATKRTPLWFSLMSGASRCSRRWRKRTSNSLGGGLHVPDPATIMRLTPCCRGIERCGPAWATVRSWRSLANSATADGLTPAQEVPIRCGSRPRARTRPPASCADERGQEPAGVEKRQTGVERRRKRAGW